MRIVLRLRDPIFRNLKKKDVKKQEEIGISLKSISLWLLRPIIPVHAQLHSWLNMNKIDLEPSGHYTE